MYIYIYVHVYLYADVYFYIEFLLSICILYITPTCIKHTCYVFILSPIYVLYKNNINRCRCIDDKAKSLKNFTVIQSSCTSTLKNVEIKHVCQKIAFCLQHSVLPLVVNAK